MIPGIVVAIDPGTHYGWSTWLEGKMVGSGSGHCDKSISIWMPGLRARLVVVEYPYFYPGDRPGQANSLIKLAYIAGLLVASVPIDDGGRVEHVKPATWKGSVPKKIHQERIKADFDAYQGRPVLLRTASDELDAIGLGLWAQTHLKGDL